MSVEIKLTRLEILEALGIDKDLQLEILKNSSDVFRKTNTKFSTYEEVNPRLDEEEQREFVRMFVGKHKEDYFRQMYILDEFRLLIKRNEIVDKIKLLSDKNLGNFAEKLVLEIAEDTNGNVELLDKVHEILNK
tara:strand:+ start:55 stop:456 length:402 start_codon:yes stop_codon:yes gene_type:complete